MDAIERASTELSVIIPSVWSKNYYDALLAELPFNSLISRDYEGEIQALGNVVKISQFPEFDEAVELAEDAAADASAITVTQQSLTINKRIVKDFIITDLAVLQSLPAMDKLKQMAAFAIQKKIQAAIIALIVPNAATPDHQIAYDSGTTLGLADALEAKELLDTQNVPMADRHVVMGPAELNDLFNITGFTSNDFVNNGGALQTGQIPPMLLGFAPHMTTVVSTTSYWFHKSFMTIAAQKGLSVKEYDKGVDGIRATRVNCDTLLGIKQLDGLRCVSLA